MNLPQFHQGMWQKESPLCPLDKLTSMSVFYKKECYHLPTKSLVISVHIHGKYYNYSFTIQFMPPPKQILFSIYQMAVMEKEKYIFGTGIHMYIHT